MDLEEIILSRSSPQLHEGLDERHALDIAYCASKLKDADIGGFIGIVNGYPSHALDPILNCIGDVWYNLYSMSKVVASSLFFNDMLVYLPRGNIVLTGQSDIEVALVIAEVEVDFTAIIEHEDLAMSTAKN